jgi:predicted alpha/beta-hydrolase family hydrolase
VKRGTPRGEVSPKTEGERVRIPLPDGGTVSGLLLLPEDAKACYVLAHGAGAGMTHPFLEGTAWDLAAREIATLRFQFPFMERGSKRPDPAPIAEAAVRAAVETAAARLPGMPLIAGGRSFGGRMASQAQARSELPGVRGLAFLGFPLHPAKKPSTVRGDHLAQVSLPMLFVQGTRDDLADLQLLRPLFNELGPRATLHLIDDADHSFHVRARVGKSDEVVRREIAEYLADWIIAATG